MDSSDSNLKNSEEEAHVVKKSEYMEIEILLKETTIQWDMKIDFSDMRQIHCKNYKFSLYRDKVFWRGCLNSQNIVFYEIFMWLLTHIIFIFLAVR